jgi:hypothetical protein
VSWEIKGNIFATKIDAYHKKKIFQHLVAKVALGIFQYQHTIPRLNTVEGRCVGGKREIIVSNRKAALGSCFSGALATTAALLTAPVGPDYSNKIHMIPNK